MRSSKNRVLVAPTVGLLAIAILIAAALAVSACSQATTEVSQEEPAKVEHPVAGDPARLTLTARAVARLGIQTATVQTAGPGQSAAAGATGGGPLVVPYAALLYDEKGDTWVYISPESLVFVRARVSVTRIQGDSALLSDGPPVGTVVVTVGAVELFGTEFGVGH